MSHTDLACPVCGTTLSMEHLLVNADDRAAVMRLLAISTPLGAAVGQYTRLFEPPKSRLSMRKQVRLVLQLLPDIERRAITHRGRDWAVPLNLWEAGIDQMLAARDAGKLALPMTGHKYLYAILVSLADKAEGVAEAQTEAAKRHPVAPAQGASQPAAMPDYVRAALVALKNSGVKPT